MDAPPPSPADGTPETIRTQTQVIVALSVTTLLVSVVNRFRPKTWFPDLTVAVVAGIVLGFFLGRPNETELEERLFTTIFFDLLMPPIAFAAALNESRTTFSGVLYAIISTVFSTFIVGNIIENHYFTHDPPLSGCLFKGCIFWGVVLAPVNARYILTSHNEEDPGEKDFLKEMSYEEEELEENKIIHPLLPIHKTLDSWLHCEALLSGPICIVFYTALQQQRFAGIEINLQQTFENFVRVLLGSIILGSLMGLFSALTLRSPFEANTRGGPYREVSLVILWAFASFFVARYLSLSAVGTLFCSGLVMKKTAMHVISNEARHAARVGSEAIAATAENFVMLYLALASFSSILTLDPEFSTNNYHIPLVVLIACLISRMIVAFVLSLLLGGGGYRIFTFMVVFLSGMRGTVSFSLALKSGLDSHKELIATSAFVAIFGHIIMGPLLALFVDSQKVHVSQPTEKRFRIRNTPRTKYNAIVQEHDTSLDQT